MKTMLAGGVDSYITLILDDADRIPVSAVVRLSLLKFGCGLWSMVQYKF
jgi:hypothetical protein